MNLSVILAVVAAITISISIVFGFRVRFKRKFFSLYWLLAIMFALLSLALNPSLVAPTLAALFTAESMNPIKILVLFLSMSAISLFLDEMNFFTFLAVKATRLTHGSQKKLFLTIYAIVSILTVFTSNDVIILTFVPFVAYFCKNAKINPVPYIFSVFVGANTWSMLLIFGNPTNIYIASSFGINFAEYLYNMFLPTLCAGAVSILLLFIIFNKSLKTTINCDFCELPKLNLPLVGAGLFALLLSVFVMAVAPYLDMEMWIAPLASCVALFVFVGFYFALKRQNAVALKKVASRIPWAFTPFLISMFIIISIAENGEVLPAVSQILNSGNPTLNFGVSVFLFSNILNNIPSSVLFSSLLSTAQTVNYGAVYAAIIGSNLCALLTPVGALAGIMFMKILEKFDVPFSNAAFVKYGAIISVPTLAVALAVLLLI